MKEDVGIMAKKQLIEADIWVRRNAAHNDFWNVYDSFKKNLSETKKKHILAYYGKSGVGKTVLLHQLMKEMSEKISNSLYIYADLKVFQETLLILSFLRNTLSQKYGLAFPIFDLALHIYLKKIGCKSNEKMIEEIKKRYEREATLIMMENSDVLYKQLSIYFAQDLNTNLKDSKEPLIIFLDNYASSYKIEDHFPFCNLLKQSTLTTPIRKDENVLANTTRFLFVVTVKNKLSCAFHAKQHRLGFFTKAETYSVLKVAGINDNISLKRIYRITSGSPLHVGLCINNHRSLMKANIMPNISDYICGKKYLIKKFLNLYKVQEAIFCMLCCMKTWDEETINKVMPMIVPEFSPLLHKKIKALPFITENNGIYILRSSIRKVIFEECLTSDFKDFYEILAKYYENKLSSLDSAELMSSILLPRYIDATKHILNTTSRSQTKFPLEQASKVLDNYKIYGDVNEKTILVQHAVARYYKVSGNYTYACDLLEKIYLLAVKNLGENNPTTIFVMEELGEIYYNFSYMHRDALTLQEQIFIKRRKICGEDCIDTVRAMYALGKNYPKWGRLSEALICLKQVVSKYNQLLGENHPYTIKAMTDLLKIYNKLKCYYDAFTLCKKIFEKYQTIFGNDNIYTINIMSQLAQSYINLNRYQEALPLLGNILLRRQKIYGNNDLGTLETMSNIAIVKNNTGNKLEALNICVEVFSKYKNLLGEDNFRTIKAMNILAKNYSSLGNHFEAAELFQQVLEKGRKYFDKNNEDMIHTMSCLADSYINLKRYHEALDLRKKILKNWLLLSRLSGVYDREINEAIEKLAETYTLLNFDTEASFLLQILKKRHEDKNSLRINAIMKNLEDDSLSKYSDVYVPFYEPLKNSYNKAVLTRTKNEHDNPFST